MGVYSVIYIVIGGYLNQDFWGLGLSFLISILCRHIFFLLFRHYRG